jgi:Ca2+-binding EF-hand superfamily protein
MFIAPQGTPTTSRESWTPRSRVSAAAEVFQQNASGASAPPAVPRHATALKSGGGIGGGISSGGNSGGALQSNALAQLQPSQMRMLRDGFEVLDRDGDGVVNREDVADMLAQLGLPANPSSMTQFFPPASPQTTTLAAYLNGLASALASLSPGPELLSAFSAFDDDDSGQADLAELRDALLHTAPDPGERALTPAEVDRVLGGFSGRRAFTKSTMGMGSKRGDVFRYQEFVGSVMGSGSGSDQASAEGARA